MLPENPRFSENHVRSKIKESLMRNPEVFVAGTIRVPIGGIQPPYVEVLLVAPRSEIPREKLNPFLEKHIYSISPKCELPVPGANFVGGVDRFMEGEEFAACALKGAETTTVTRTTTIKRVTIFEQNTISDAESQITTDDSVQKERNEDPLFVTVYSNAQFAKLVKQFYDYSSSHPFKDPWDGAYLLYTTLKQDDSARVLRDMEKSLRKKQNPRRPLRGLFGLGRKK